MTKLKDILDYLDEADQFGRDFVMAFGVQPLNSYRSQASLILFSRIYQNLKACKILLAEGYGTSCAVISRAIVEDFINLFYIVNNKKGDKTREKMAERYLDYHKVVPSMHAETLKSLGVSLSVQDKKVIMNSRNDFMTKYNVQDDKELYDWSGKSARHKAMQGNVKTFYLTLYTSFSGMTHGSPDTWRYLFKINSDTATYSIGPSDDFIDQNAFGLCIMFVSAIELLATEFGMTDYVSRAKRLLADIVDSEK